MIGSESRHLGLGEGTENLLVMPRMLARLAR